MSSIILFCRERGVKYGVESICSGGGMGAAALFELCVIKDKVSGSPIGLSA